MRLLAALVLPVLFVSCGDEEPPQIPTRKDAPYATAPSRPADSTKRPDHPVSLKNITRDAGITFIHDNGTTGKKWLPETMGSGVAWFDADGDGDDDLLLLGASRLDRPATSTTHCYRNDGNGRFVDVTSSCGINLPVFALGVAVADVDGDQDTDVFVTGLGGYRYFENLGGFKFRDQTDASGLHGKPLEDAKGPDTPSFPTSAAFADIDLDGLPDLFVCHYVRWSAATDVWATIDGKTKSYAIPDQYQGESCRLWRNLGKGRFEDITIRAGIRNDESKALGVCVIDINADGAPDFFVANDKWANFLYLNDGSGNFRDVALEWNVAYGPDGRARAGMGIDVGCLDEQLLPTIAIGNFSNEPLSLFELALPKGESDRNAGVMINRADVTGVAALTQAPLTFGVVFADLDLDGLEDLILANGHIEPTIGDVHSGLTYAQPAQWLRNLGGRRFADNSRNTGADLLVPLVGRGLAVSDLDRDGDLDVLMTSNGGTPTLLRCDTPPNRSLAVRLRGTRSGTDALGATVRLVNFDGSNQIRTVHSGSSYLSASTYELIFGLGKGDPAKEIIVRWPAKPAHSVTYTGPFKPGRLVIDEQTGILR